MVVSLPLSEHNGGERFCRTEEGNHAALHRGRRCRRRPPALLAAIISTSSLLGWITVGVSAVGLVLLVVNEVRERAPYDTDEQDVGASPPPPPQEDIVVPTDEEPSIAAEPANNEEVLRPDIWP